MTAVEKLVSDVSKDGAVRDIYTMRYKEGPVLREMSFYSTSLQDAQKDAERFIEHLKGRENHRCQQLGVAQPFCQTIDEMIKIWNKKNRPSEV